MKPQSATGATDWGRSLARQLELYQWLQSSEGGIAGGVTNSCQGSYSTPPTGTPTFYGMFYDSQPVWHDPPSNKWFGFQAWSMERVAEYYYVTGDAKAKAILDKWVAWAAKNTTVKTDGTFSVPSELTWTGAPDTWDAASPGKDAGLHVSVACTTQDVGLAGSLAKTLSYYGAKANNATAKTLAKKLLDGMWTASQDAQGISAPCAAGTRTTPNGRRCRPIWSGSAPTLRYHRFGTQADVATAFAVYAEVIGCPRPAPSPRDHVIRRDHAIRTPAGLCRGLQTSGTSEFVRLGESARSGADRVAYWPPNCPPEGI
jgi:hypothetical protein